MSPKDLTYEERIEERARAQLENNKPTDRFYQKCDEHQKAYWQAILKNPVVFVDKKAGTGKTTIALAVGLQLLRSGKVNSIVYVRFPDQRSGKLGFLPGDQAAKENNLMQPFYDAMTELGLQYEAINFFKNSGIFELTSDIGMRGRNLKNTFLILDESQNADIESLRLLLTRLHDEGGKAVCIGHSGQIDSKLPRYGKEKLLPFQVYKRHMLKKNWTVECDLPRNYRGKISTWADEIEQTIKEIEQG